MYKQFDREVYNALIQCECVKKHNRANPSHLIDNKTQNILGEFKISTGEYINDDDFVNVIQNMYATTPLFISVQKNLYCEQGICEIPVSPFSKMF